MSQKEQYNIFSMHFHYIKLIFKIKLRKNKKCLTINDNNFKRSGKVQNLNELMMMMQD